MKNRYQVLVSVPVKPAEKNLLTPYRDNALDQSVSLELSDETFNTETFNSKEDALKYVSRLK